MLLIAKIDLNNEGILAQIEKTRKSWTEFDNELCRLKDVLAEVSIQEKGDSEESP